MKRLLTVVLGFATFTGIAFAHNGMEHVMGTVTEVSPTALSVKAADGKIHTLTLNAKTKFSKGTTASTVKDVKVGQHVVINVPEEGDQHVAAEVKLGTASDAQNMKGMKGDMKGMNMPEGKASH